MSVHLLALTASRPQERPLAPVLTYVSARSWWLLKTHVAEANGLPRSSAGPEPTAPAGR